MSDTSVTPFKGRLTRTELRRRFWHMAPGALPFLLWAIPHQDPLSPTLSALILIVALSISAAVFLRYRQIQRSAADHQKLAAVSGYTLSVLFTLWLFSGAAEIGFTVLTILAFGDGSATFGGLFFGGPSLPWNPRKTWSGFLSFLLVGTTVATAAFWGESHNAEALTPGVTVWTALACAGAGVLAAALAESIPSKINDNIRVGVTAAVVVAAMHFWLVG